jgi:16S rRNA processing protein RimM
MAMTAGAKLVLLGRIAAAHGVRGDVLIKSFTAEPAAIAAYGPLQDAEGSRRFELRVVRVTPKGVVARVSGVVDRNAAEALKGVDLYVPRERLPAAEPGAYYHADLIGLRAIGEDGSGIGEVVAVADYGAGDLLEIRLEGSRRTEFVPFTSARVPEVDVAEGRIVVRLTAAAAEEDGEAEADEP